MSLMSYLKHKQFFLFSMPVPIGTLWLRFAPCLWVHFSTKLRTSLRVFPGVGAPLASWKLLRRQLCPLREGL